MRGLRYRLACANVTGLAALLILPGLGGAYAADRIVSPQAASASTSESGARPAKVIQLSYSRWYEGHSLLAFARRTDSLRFATRYRGKKASAPARRSSVTDTDIKGEASRGWNPIRKRGGRKVIRLVRKSLDRRGVAKVRTRAKRDGLLDDHWWRIVLAKCSQDPPLYPVDCEIARSGKHFRL